jgi:threonyl-tRNA synthetase
LQKLPYIAVVGEREAESGGLNIRSRDRGELGAMSVEAFFEQIEKERYAPTPTEPAVAAE